MILPRLTCLLTCFIALNCFGQEVVVSAQNKALDEVLSNLKTEYDLQLSYSPDVVEGCRVNIENTFKNPEEAIAALLAPCRIEYTLRNDVYIIHRDGMAKVPEPDPPRLHLKGQVVDALSKEPLPFSSVQIDNTILVTDVDGNFSFMATDTSVSVKTTHLGYYPLDTACTVPAKMEVPLMPSVVDLREVTVTAYTDYLKIPMLSEVGHLKLNHQLATFLPGNNDNTIFNLLRLQPGVLAAGEQTKDFIIWGSYKGQTSVKLDGMTLFNTSGALDNVGSVNPLIIKDIEVFKGGYNAHVGDRIGGVVKITSTDGEMDRKRLVLNINNQTTSIMGSTPIGKRSVLQAGYRLTYFGISDFERFKKGPPLEPRAVFRDLNLKFTRKTKGGDSYKISVLSGTDITRTNIVQERDRKRYMLASEVVSHQNGISFRYNKNWKSGGNTEFLVAGSDLQTTHENQLELKDFRSPDEKRKVLNSTLNIIKETSLSFKHHFVANKRHRPMMGVGIISNAATFSMDSLDEKLKGSVEHVARLSTFFKDHISFGKKLEVTPGIKIEMPGKRPKLYIQPRLGMKYVINKKIKLNAAYGRYNQFITENALVDQWGNSLYFWSMADNSFGSVLSSDHFVTGFVFAGKHFDLKTDFYYKDMNGLSRFEAQDNEIGVINKQGIARAYGMDVLVNKSVGKHTFWLGYSLSKTEEVFVPRETSGWQRAAHDQRHELKGAGMLNFRPFYFSTSYVYGSGIPNSTEVINEDYSGFYSRLDCSIMYRFNSKKSDFEVGFSILNVLDQSNVRFNNFSYFPDNKSAYEEATEFTPMVFLNMKF